MTPPVVPVVTPPDPNNPNPANPPAGNIKPPVDLAAIHAVSAREAIARAERAEARIRELESTPPAPVTPTDQQEKDFFNKPLENTRNVVKQLLDESMAPMKATVEAFARDRAYQNLKIQFSSHQVYGPLFANAQFVQLLDVMMQNQEANSNNMQAAILSIRGASAMGLTPGLDFSAPAIAPVVPVTPPSAHLAPSAPPAPSGSLPAAPRALTEAEKAEMRRQGLTEEQYRRALELPAEATIADLTAAFRPPVPTPAKA